MARALMEVLIAPDMFDWFYSGIVKVARSKQLAVILMNVNDVKSGKVFVSSYPTVIAHLLPKCQTQ